MSLIRPSSYLLLLVFISGAFSFAITLMPALLAATGQLSPIMASLVLALASLLSGFWQPIVGRWLDQGRVLLTFLIVASAYSFGIMIFVPENTEGILLILGALALCLAVTTLRTVMSLAIIGRLQGKDREEMAGKRYLVANCSLAVASVLAFTFLKTHRAALLWLDLATTLILLSGAVYYLKRQRLQSPGSTTSSQSIRRLLKSSLQTNASKLLGLCLITIGFLSHITYLPLLLTSKGLPAAEMNAKILLLNTTLVVLGMPLIRRLSRKWSLGEKGFVGTLLLAFGLAPIPLLSSLPALLLVTVVWTIGEMLFIPWEQVKFYECFPDSEPGLASGAITFLMSLCQVVSPLLGTILLISPLPLAAFLQWAVPLFGLALFYWGDSAKVWVKKSGVLRRKAA